MVQIGTIGDQANQVEPAQPLEVIPPGKYVAHIVKSELQATKDGTGQMIWWELDILDGQFKGRKLWDRLNVVNSNPQAQEIALRALKAAQVACGLPVVRDTEELHFKAMLVTVKVRPAGNDKSGVYREAQNEIRGYEPLPGGAPVQQHAPAPAPQQQAYQQRTAAPPPQVRPAAGGGTPPWKQQQG